MICISLGNINFEEALQIASGEEMIELRADLLGFSDRQYKSLIRESSKVVFTCRPGTMDATDRLSLFELAASEEVEYIDLELESVETDLEYIQKLTEGKNTDIILSYHNYKETPDSETLVSILKNCFKLGADVAKIATLVQSDDDLVNLFSLYRRQGRKVILGMGEKGILSRVAAVVMGGEFSFAFPDTGEMTAPGQLRVSEMKELFKLMKI